MKHGEGEKEQNEISYCSSSGGLGKGLFGRVSRNKKWCLNLGICDCFSGWFFFLSYNAGVFSYIKLRMLWFLQITYTHPSHGPAQLPPSPWLSLEVIKLHMQPRDDLQVVFAHSLGQKSWGGEAWRGWEGMQGCPGECGSRFNQCGISSSCGPEEHLCFSWSVIRDGWWAP